VALILLHIIGLQCASGGATWHRSIFCHEGYG